MKLNDRVLITSTSFSGQVKYEGEGVVKEVRKHSSHIEYIVACQDGIPRSVDVGDSPYKGDKICLK